MIYEIRTYTLKSGGVPEFEAEYVKLLPYREKYSKLGAFWHTEFGPLNQVIHIWPYKDMNERVRIREEASKDPHWPPKTSHLLMKMESEILIPAPFMRPFGNQQLGNFYELRIYTYQPGAIPEVIKRFAECIEYREKYSPLAGCWHSEFGGLNKWYHLWPYKSLEERAKIRAEAAKDPHWPPKTREFIISQENKILIPAPFSPMR